MSYILDALKKADAEREREGVPTLHSQHGAPAGIDLQADAAERLVMVTDLLRSELRAMNVIPSLPATEVARTRWSPN